MSCAAVVEKGGYQVAAVNAVQRLDNAVSVIAVVPEKVLPLGEFLFSCRGAVNFLAGVRVNAGIVYFGSKSHRGRSEIQYLLKVHVQLFGAYGYLSHVGFGADGVT